MSYLGKTPSQATRARYYYTATGSETSLSGADDNGNTLVFSDGNYVDVMLNGVTLVAGTDYDTDTANTIDNLSALTASDVVEIVVYDTFSVFGGNVLSNFSIQNGVLSVDDGTESAPSITNNGDTNTGIFFPAANTIAFTEGGSEAARIDSGGRLLVGTTDGNPTLTSDNGIAIQGDGRIFGHTGDWALSRSGDGVFINFFESTGGTRSSILGSIGISGGGLGISFDGNSNYLDDYEEGTYTVTLTPASGSITLNSSINLLTYTKIGRMVHITGRINISSVSSPSGAVTISLPFTSIDGSEESDFNYGDLVLHNMNIPSGVSRVFTEISPNTSEATMRSQVDDSAWPVYDGSNFDASGTEYIGFNFTYTTA